MNKRSVFYKVFRLALLPGLSGSKNGRSVLLEIVLVMLVITTAQNTNGQDIIKSTYTYKSIGDLKIHADVYYKPDGLNRPVIFWIHGGALIMGNRRGLNPVQAEKYINEGYTIVAVDYRLAPQVKVEQIIEDIKDAYRWLLSDGQKLFSIDPARIAVIGHSAGGYLSLMAGISLKPSPRAIVSFYGYGDIAGSWYSEPDPYYNSQPAVSKEEAYQSVGTATIADDQSGKRSVFYLYCRQKGLWPLEVAGYDPETRREELDRFCPLRHVTKDYPPTLLLHGDTDTDVPYEQSVMMAKELELKGVPYEFISIHGRGHGFDSKMEDPEISATFDRVLKFLDKWMKP